MSYMGVPSIRSAPTTVITGPRVVSVSIRLMRTDDNPRALGRNGERVAKTPIFSLPPNSGGRTTSEVAACLLAE